MKGKSITAHFFSQPDSSPGWTSSFYKSLAEVDAVILLGGGDTTYIAGTVALNDGKSVVAVGAFGGTAKTIWDELVFDPELLKRSEKDNNESSYSGAMKIQTR